MSYFTPIWGLATLGSSHTRIFSMFFVKNRRDKSLIKFANVLRIEFVIYLICNIWVKHTLSRQYFLIVLCSFVPYLCLQTPISFISNCRLIMLFRILVFRRGHLNIDKFLGLLWIYMLLRHFSLLRCLVFYSLMFIGDLGFFSLGLFLYYLFPDVLFRLSWFHPVICV